MHSGKMQGSPDKDKFNYVTRSIALISCVVSEGGKRERKRERERERERERQRQRETETETQREQKGRRLNL